MYDAGKSIAGVIIFLILLISPILYNVATGEASYAPDPLIAAEAGDQCIESKDYMRDRHMDLVDNWRNTVVRGGNRIYCATDGKQWDMSLTDTCLGCHTNKSHFCDRCHDYSGVTPSCWDCHNIVEGE